MFSVKNYVAIDLMSFAAGLVLGRKWSVLLNIEIINNKLRGSYMTKFRKLALASLVAATFRN